LQEGILVRDSSAAETNMHLQRTVIGVDFSPASTEAARWAAKHFQSGVELILTHVISSRDGDRDAALQTGTEQLRQLGESLGAERIRFETREGNAARSLSDIAIETGADLLVVGARGERGGRDGAIGTTAQYVVRESTVPVLVVARPSDDPVDRILVPVDDDATARESLRWAALISDRFGAIVTMLHVDARGAMSHPASPHLNTRPAKSVNANPERWISLASELGIPEERVTVEESFGVPAVEIVSAATRSSADIIVMGRTAASSLRRAVLGSVTSTVLSNPPCSVLVVFAN
jgi:nucleotide-binding universal stress UspA family protein